jgi:hypothetical protein
MDPPPAATWEFRALTLYWNTRVFHRAKRKGLCPYQHLGLKLQSYDFWTLLQGTPIAECAKASADFPNDYACAA